MAAAEPILAPINRVYGHVVPPVRWLMLLVIGMPLIWFAGGAAFVWQLAAVPLLVSLIHRGNLRVPRGFGLWLAFLGWIALAIAAAGGLHPVAAVLHIGPFVAATVLFLYVYNASQTRLPDRAVIDALALLWVLLVVGGFVAVVLPTLSFPSVLERVAPASVTQNEFLRDLLHVRFAQVQSFLGYEVGRPSIFFTYTNGWGAMVGILTPVVVASIAGATSRFRRRGLTLLLPLSAIPITVSLNRGLWLALVVALAYVALRFALAGKLRALFAVAAVGALVAALLTLTAFGGLISDRLETKSQSTETRARLYDETVEAIRASPLVGYGGPQRSASNPRGAPLGTHSEALFLALAFGVPGLLLCGAWFFMIAVRSGRRTSGPRFWLHVAVLVFLVEAPYYLLQAHLPVVMIVAALLLRPAAKPTRGRTVRVDRPVRGRVSPATR